MGKVKGEGMTAAKESSGEAVEQAAPGKCKSVATEHGAATAADTARTVAFKATEKAVEGSGNAAKRQRRGSA